MADILKVHDIEELLGLGRSTVYRYVNEGLLPAIRIGQTIRFRREAIDSFIASQEARFFEPPTGAIAENKAGVEAGVEA